MNAIPHTEESHRKARRLVKTEEGGKNRWTERERDRVGRGGRTGFIILLLGLFLACTTTARFT